MQNGALLICSFQAPLDRWVGLNRHYESYYINVMYWEETCVWPGCAPDSSDVCQLSHVIANATHKIHWHACTRGHTHAPLELPHAFTRWCCCAMGTSTSPKQAVAHVSMPVMSVCNPSRKIAAKMGVQGCREDSVHEALGPYW